MSIGDFVLGFASPFVASGVLVYVARLAASGRGGQSISFAIPIAVLALAVVAAVTLWGSRRAASYGLLAAVGLGAVVSLFWWFSHVASGGTAPPPPST